MLYAPSLLQIYPICDPLMDLVKTSGNYSFDFTEIVAIHPYSSLFYHLFDKVTANFYLLGQFMEHRI